MKGDSLYTTVLLLLTGVSASPVQDIQLRYLNQTCQGRLFAAAPLAQPCFTKIDGSQAVANQESCVTVQAQYQSANFRTDHYSGFMNEYGETCAASTDARTAGCLLDPVHSNQSGRIESQASCGQGSLSRHYIKVRDANDVRAAFLYALATGKTLSIKNSGHDYHARSSLKGSLALWTRHLQNMTYSPKFTPTGCEATGPSFSAVTVGAGVNFDAAYTFAEQNNVTFVGGSSPTVGASGGFSMAGGHGLLTAQFGLAIDRILEYRIVTPDGRERIANACQNQDLFWALRGGGGGTFGVTLATTHRVEPRLGLIFALITLPPGTNDTSRFTQIMMENAIRWSREGWGGPNSPASLAMVNPFLTLEEAQISMNPLIAHVQSLHGNVLLQRFSSFYDIYDKFIRPAANPNVPAATLPTNRLIPTSLLESAAGRTQIQAYLALMQRSGFQPTIFQTPPAYYQAQGHYEEGSTSATPAWRKSVWMITSNTFWAWNSTVSEKRRVVREVQKITKAGHDLAPDSGSYVNEADAWTTDWQSAWWGRENYAKLLSIKNKYDPLRLLKCWRCVGSETKSERPGQLFECMGGLVP